MEAICTKAWCPDLNSVIVTNVLQNVHNTRNVTIIFPECGSAYHEWQVVCALARRGHDITKVVFMDSAICLEWTETWQQVAKEQNVEIVILKSYIALREWAQSKGHLNLLVLYINGTVRFTPYYCGQEDVEECMASASAFWEWCHQFAINRTPLNYVRHNVFQIAGCTTWKELAITFNTRQSK